MLESVYRALATTMRPVVAEAVGRTTCSAARENVHHHYDLGNEFYRLWLDRGAWCTRAPISRSPTATLEDAQIAKMDLRVPQASAAPGERVVEAGCGWGALALLHGAAVRRAGAGVQHLARADRLRASPREAGGLADRVEFVDDDYRSMHGQLRRLRVGRHARACGPGRLSRRSAPSSIARWRSMAADCCTSSAATGRRRSTRGSASASSPGAYPPTLREVCRGRARTARLLGARCREPAAALREDARALAAPVRRRVRTGARDVRRAVRAGMAALPGRVAGRVHHRLHAAVSGGVRSRHRATIRAGRA